LLIPNLLFKIKKKRAAELVVANTELTFFQNEEKRKIGQLN
jgi:hypothetical protein